MRKVIFDTDIGIDDAMALLFLHYARNVELRAIVTGFGNASIDDTTRNALYVSERFNIAAPVYRGAAESTGTSLFDSYPDFVHGKNGLGDVDIPHISATQESAGGAQAIVDIATANPGDITIVAVGRLSNVANALKLCPELPQLLRELVVMGGAFGFNGHRGNVSPVAEANIAGDPEAADFVFRSGIPTTIVGLDVTAQTTMDDDFFELLKNKAGDAGQFIFDISRHYLDFHEQHTGRHACAVHDSSAVAYLLAPELFTTRDAGVRVVSTGPAIGQTIWSDPEVSYQTGAWSELPRCRICTDVDSAGVLDLYRKTLLSAVDNS
ncbi:MAG: nucleoside hydrolase [Gammaproteobacteria bacterium]|nr:nucleoside hydrolase [Gammaproteobacteria bacterium]MDH5303430.1 nucleoside hydrolase [Gammaproteobacteria bacterium]MDH5321763.1 nucleoside hydrolase [Gammaproteobacteria bacterium]